MPVAQSWEVLKKWAKPAFKFEMPFEVHHELRRQEEEGVYTVEWMENDVHTMAVVRRTTPHILELVSQCVDYTYNVTFWLCPDVWKIFIMNNNELCEHEMACIKELCALMFGDRWQVEGGERYQETKEEVAKNLCDAACALRAIIPNVCDMARFMRPTWFDYTL